ncbi:hypothetical protein THAOC_27293, partial [Thalassiosira oceanica]
AARDSDEEAGGSGRLREAARRSAREAARAPGAGKPRDEEEEGDGGIIRRGEGVPDKMAERAQGAPVPVSPREG